MNELQAKFRTFLQDAAQKLREAGLPANLSASMERLGEEVDQPCVVAVVGRMKAGKSTFINALLGEDLAKVGVTETTATINRFRHGTPNPSCPVRCYWQNGSVTEESRAFLDGLQGNDIETIRRAEGIKYLEYSLLNPYLERITLVDTPGMSATVDEHADRTAKYLALQRQLRDRHNADTQRLASEATAVIYLVGQVARATDQAFLKEFGEVTGSRSKALNAVGVLAKIDLNDEVLRRRHELANKIGKQLQDNLNTVVPVSASLQRAMDRLKASTSHGISHFLTTLQRIPAKRLNKFLDNEEFYREMESDDCPVSIADRERLLGDLPWATFTVLARTAVACSFEPAATEDKWRALAGFHRLRNVLDQHIFQRAHFLRCFQVLQQAHQLVNTVRYEHLRQSRQQDREQKARLDRFLRFVQGAEGDQSVAKELEEFLCKHSGLQGRSGQIEEVWRTLDRRIAEFTQELEEANADLGALQCIDDHATLFTSAELDELRCLFGLYGLEPLKRVAGKLEIKHLATRQQHWLAVSQLDGSPERRQVGEHAATRYGWILAGC